MEGCIFEVLYSDPKDAGLFCGSFLRKGEVFAHVGLIQNLKILKDLARQRCRV